MKEIIKEIAGLFIIVVFANLVVEFSEEKTVLMTNPLKFFGIALGVSIIGGLITHWIKRKTKQA